MPRSQPPDPFRVLGLTPDPELSDDDVRAAWRRAAAATHPDRADGGDPGAFAAAAAAYTVLRTPAARRDAVADMTIRRRARTRLAHPRWRLPRWRLPAVLGSAHARVWRGSPGRLALRTVAAAGIAAVAVAAVGWQPASIGVTTGALTWLLLTGRTDLAPPPARARPWPRRPM
jgi:DnaJ domain